MDDATRDMIEEAGFHITDEVDIGSLADVKEERSIIPPAKKVKLRIRKVSLIESEDKTYRMLNLSCGVEDGIPQPDGSVKYKNMVVWAKVTFYADPKKYTKDYFKNRQHLVELKKLIIATGGDVTSTKVNDEFIASLQNKIVYADIKQKINKFTAKDGTLVEEMQNYVANFQVAPIDNLV